MAKYFATNDFQWIYIPYDGRSVRFLAIKNKFKVKGREIDVIQKSDFFDSVQRMDSNLIRNQLNRISYLTEILPWIWPGGSDMSLF